MDIVYPAIYPPLDVMNVNEAALDVGYVSTSQFSREFKRMYGQPPKQWIHSKHQLSV